jgi:hypothetical protein
MTTQEIFTLEIDRLWNELKNRDDTIFENVGFCIDSTLEFEKLKENSSVYMILVQESSTYEKKKMIRSYFWDTIIGELYENTIKGLRDANVLEETLRSFDKNYRLEQTATLILENGIFAKFDSVKKKELTENIIEMAFYPATHYQKNIELISGDILEENWVPPVLQWGGDRIRDIARLTSSIYTFMTYALISPATFLMAGGGSRISDYLLDKYDGRAPSGTDPSLRKFYSLMDSFNPLNFLFKFLNKDLYDVANLLKKVNSLDDSYVQDILKEMKANPNKMIKKCWDKNKHQVATSDPSNKKAMDLILHFFSGKGLANMLRDPFYNNETQIAHILQKDAADASYQKMFYDFRICIYEKLFEVILGYSKAIYSMDDASYEIIKAANDAHQSKNFKAFFDLKPKQVNEEAMFKIMRALVSIDSIANTLDKRKGELVADKYIDKFSAFLRQNIKQVYGELNEMANQKKYNESRYSEEDPDDETKAKVAKEERFQARKSIFDNE